MPPGETRRQRFRGVAVLACLAVVAGCGGDGDDEDSLESIPERAAVREYCDAWNTVEQAIADPAAVQMVPDQLDRLLELAPDEVAGDVAVVVDGLRQAQGGDPAGLGSSSFEDARQRVEEHQRKLETEGDAPCEQGFGDLDG